MIGDVVTEIEPLSLEVAVSQPHGRRSTPNLAEMERRERDRKTVLFSN
jgi:hypothetical protein